MDNRLIHNLEKLNLEKLQSYLPNYLDSISGKDITLSDALLHLTDKEIEFRDGATRSQLKRLRTKSKFRKEQNDLGELIIR